MTDFARYLKNFDADMQRLRGVMHAHLGSEVALIAEMEAGEYLTGGKRLRAIISLLTARLCGVPPAQGDAVAVAIEFIHTATLLHDDVVDNAPMRRHLPAVARVYGNAAAVLAGDFLYSRASQMLAQTQSLPLLQRVADATNKLAEGELLQLLQRDKTDLHEQTYYQIIEYKTANLFSVAAAAAADLRGQDAAALSAYGRHLGIAFQLVDDCLDYEGDDAQLGKQTGADWSEGKITLPLILFLAQQPAAQRAAVLQQARRGGLREMIMQLRGSGALAAVRTRAAQEAQAAVQALADFPDSADKAALITLAQTSVQRDK